MFDSLPRSDQLRCAEAYLYGLLYGTGRRSSRGIASSADRSDQALQQFVNQSPWQSAPVRRRIGVAMTELVERSAAGLANPADAGEEIAWTLDEVAFTKNGRYSVGVERQFVPTLGRTANAQLAVGLQVAGTGLSGPLNWRLCLPPSWHEDQPRRTRARVPDPERHQPYWQNLIALVDEATGELGLPARPIVTDFTGRQDLPALLEAFRERKLDYLVRVNSQQPVQSLLPTPTMTAAGRACRLADLTASTIRTARETVTWRQHLGKLRSQFLTVPIVLGAASGRPLPRLGQLRVLVEWPFNSLAPTGFWITNLVSEPVASLARLVKHASGAPAMAEMAERYGLLDFEGRSFPGWHHHVTLVSAAYLYGLGAQLPDLAVEG